MIELMDYNHPARFDLVTIGGDWIKAEKCEVERIAKENLAAAQAINPAYKFIRNFELARDAWMPRRGKSELSDEREMKWRRSRIDRILRLGGGKE